MTDKIFDIAFVSDGNQNSGWVNPSDECNEAGTPVSFHLVLNETSFGHLSFQDSKWSVRGDRPAKLVELAGREIEKQYHL